MLLLLASQFIIPEALKDTTSDNKNLLDIYTTISPSVVGIYSKSNNIDFYGTGVIISNDGFVLTTTTTVPADAENIKIVHTNGKIYSAQLIGYENELEVSLLKIKINNKKQVVKQSKKQTIEKNNLFSSISIGDSTAVKIGNTCYTFGNAFNSIFSDWQVSMSKGIVSSKYKIQPREEEFATYNGIVFETTAAVNPGMDGGPLTDERGVMIGLISLSFSKQRWLGVAIPINNLKKFILKYLPKDKLNFAKYVPPTPSIPNELMQKFKDKIVKIHTKRKSLSQNKLDKLNIDYKSYQEWLEGMRQTTGIIISKDGLILTSLDNVLDNFSIIKSMQIELSNGNRYKANIIQKNYKYNLAILKLESDFSANNFLPFIDFSDFAEQDTIYLGEEIFVVSSGIDKEFPVAISSGTISAFSRFNDLAYQVDAKINFTTSGGVLVNKKGKILGLISFINNPYDLHKGFAKNSGIGFAVKSHFVLEELNSLANTLHKKTRNISGYTQLRKPNEIIPKHIQNLLDAYVFIGRGSGVIISADGYILTNYHVIYKQFPNNTAQIELIDGRKFDATIVNSDILSDLSLLKIETDQPLNFAKIGDSKKIAPGEKIIAIGNPFILDIINRRDSKSTASDLKQTPSVSQGIISAKGLFLSRPLGQNISQMYFDLIQTDAAVNPGNSGGPLFDSQGNLIGINCSLRNRWNVVFKELIFFNTGAAYAIPTHYINKLIPMLKSGKNIKHGSIKNVEFKPLDFYLTDRGMQIVKISTHSKAYKAGLRKGDSIIKINGFKISNLKRLSIISSMFLENEIVDVIFSSNNRIKHTKLNLDEY